MFVPGFCRSDSRSLAGRTGAERIVETEQPRLRGGVEDVAARTDQALIENQLGFFSENSHPALAPGEGGFDRIRQTLQILARFQAIHQDPDRYGVIEGRQILFAQAENLAADLHADKTFFLKSGDPGRTIAGRFGTASKGDGKPGPRRPGRHRGQHIRRLLGAHFLSALPADQGAGAGVQQPQVIDDFRQGADGSPRAARQSPSGHRDRRRHIADEIGIRLVQALEELPRVGGEALQIAALGLGVQGIKRQAALAGAADPRDDRQPAQRHIDIHAFQIVDAHAAQRDDVGFHG